MKDNEHRINNKKAAATAAAVIVAAGTVIGGSYDSPAELLDDSFTDADTLIECAEDRDTDTDGVAVTENSSRRSRIRALVDSMPMWVRASIGVPLWCVGWLLITVVSGLWGVLLSPALAAILKWLCTAGLLLALVLVMLKAVFPDMPLKNIFNKRSILTAFIGLALVAAADTALKIFMPDNKIAAEMVRFFGTMAVFTLSAIPIIIAEVKRRRELAASDEPADRELRLRRKALELADSVSDR